MRIIRNWFMRHLRRGPSPAEVTAAGAAAFVASLPQPVLCPEGVPVANFDGHPLRDPRDLTFWSHPAVAGHAFKNSSMGRH